MHLLHRIAALLALALVFAGCAKHPNRTRIAPSANPVPTAAAKETVVRATATISGVIAPYQNVGLTSSLSEPTDQVLVNEGDRVHAGEALAILDTADLRAELAQAQATVLADIRNADSADAKAQQARYTEQLNLGSGVNQVASSRAALAQAQQTLANDQANLQRYQALTGSGYIALQTVQQQQTAVQNDEAAVRNAQANLRTAITNEQVNGSQSQGLQASTVAAAVADARSAHAAVEQARAQVQQYQTTIGKATIVSPVDGTIVNRNLNPGEYPGSRTIFTVQQLNQVYAMLNASSTDTFSIPVGAPASLTVSGTASNAYSGKVVAVLGQVTPGSTNFTVKVLVSNPDQRLQSGLPVTATVSLPPVSGVGIPTTAFLDDTHTSVMIASDELVDVVAKTVHVHELASDGTTSIVTGLKPGQEVIANGQLGITDGQSLAQGGGP